MQGHMATLFARILWCEPELMVQGAVLVIMLGFWQLLLMVVHHIAEKWMTQSEGKDRLWAERAVKRVLGRAKLVLYVETRMEEARKAFIRGWLIALQHIASAALCFPIVAGFLDEPIAAALMRQGALTELAFELTDYMENIYKRFSDPEYFKETFSPTLLAIMTCHHLMGTMVIPMNLYYPNERYYGMMVFSLQLTAGVSYLCSQYAYTLDVTQHKDLLQMRFLNIVSWLGIAISRGPVFYIVAYKLLAVFYADSAMVFFTVGIAVVLAMSAFNLIIFADATARMAKFMKKAAAIECTKEEEDAGDDVMIKKDSKACLKQGLLQNVQPARCDDVETASMKNQDTVTQNSCGPRLAVGTLLVDTAWSKATGSNGAKHVVACGGEESHATPAGEDQGKINQQVKPNKDSNK